MPLNFQDTYLAQMKHGKYPAVIYLMNGFQLKGRVMGFDQFTVIIEGPEGRLQCVYKHAISTISPAVDLPESFAGEVLRGALDIRSETQIGSRSTRRLPSDVHVPALADPGSVS